MSYDVAVYQFNETAVKVSAIDTFVKNESMVKSVISVGESRQSKSTNESFDAAKVLVISDVAGNIDLSIVEKYAKLSYKNTHIKGNSLNYCYFESKKAVDAGVADGLLLSEDGVEDFVDTNKHYVCFEKLEGGKVLMADLTAWPNIDETNDGFEVLLLIADTMDELLVRMDRLYGGKWQVFDEEQ